MHHNNISRTAGPVVTASDPAGSQRGFTLIELLVVLFVVGVGALVVLDNMQSMYRKYELDSSAHTLGAFFDTLPNTAKEQNQEVFLLWDPANLLVTITLDSAGTQELQRHELPEYLDVMPDTARTYRCDTLGRTYSGTSSTMLTAIQEFRMTHTSMLDGRVEPAMTYTLSLSPLWNMTTSKQLD